MMGLSPTQVVEAFAPLGIAAIGANCGKSLADTDQIVEEMVAWQSRPLDPLYAVLLIDCLVIKVRGSQVANRPVYVAIGVNLDGERDVLGLWLGPAGGEGAKQWATMLTELRNRGLQDALIVCCDGLKGLPESIRLTWPEATVQTCVVHMVRNSLRYSSKKHWSKITAAMREIYTAPTVEAAEARFAEFAGEWESALPCNDPGMAVGLDRVRTLPRVSRGAAQGRLHDQRDRIAERALPPRCPSPRPLPQRAIGAEGPVPRRDAAAKEPAGHDRQDQRLEDHPQHADRALRRPDRSKLDQLKINDSHRPLTQRI